MHRISIFLLCCGLMISATREDAASEAQDYWSFGDHRFYIDESLPGVLRVPPHGSEALGSHRYLTTVGGVTFEAAGLTIGLPGLAEAKLAGHEIQQEMAELRFLLKGEGFSLRVPSWILVPAVEFAASDFSAAASLFGTGPDPFNYFYIELHPALKDTLIGMRILQADIVLMDPQEFCTFPAYNGEIVLGAREDLPETEASELAAEQLSTFMSSFRYQAWLLNDIGEKVRVAASDRELTLSLTPFFYFWIGREQGDYILNELRYRLQFAEEATAEEIARTVEELENSLAASDEVVALVRPTNWLKTNRALLEECNASLFRSVDTFAALVGFFRVLAREEPAVWSEVVAAAEGLARGPDVRTPNLWLKSW